MKDHLKEREIIDLAKKIFVVCLQKQVSGAPFFDGCPYGFQLPLVAGAIEPPLHSRRTKLNHCPVTGWRHFLSARLWSCSGRSPRPGGSSQQGADHAEAEPSPLLVGDQQVRKLADIAFFIFWSEN